MGRFAKLKARNKREARERVDILFDLAKQEFNSNPERSHRYARMILDLVQKFRIHLPNNIKRFICKECGHFLMPGENLRVESRGGFMVYSCLDCGNVKKYGYVKEQREA